jgi:hypothetical protein
MDDAGAKLRDALQRGQDGLDEGVTAIAVERRGSMVNQCQFAG